MSKLSHYTSDTQMLLLIDMLKALNKIRFEIEFCDAIGLLKQNLVNIRNGKNHFTPEHIKKAITTYKVDANWVFGISDNIFLYDNPVSEKSKNSTQTRTQK